MKSFPDAFFAVLRSGECQKRFPDRFTAAEFRDYFAKHCGDRTLAKEASLQRVAAYLGKAETKKLVEADRSGGAKVYQLKKKENKKVTTATATRKKQEKEKPLKGGGVNSGGSLKNGLAAAGINGSNGKSAAEPEAPATAPGKDASIDPRITDIQFFRTKLKGLEDEAQKKVSGCTFGYSNVAEKYILDNRPEEFQQRHEALYRACTELGVMCTNEEADDLHSLVSGTPHGVLAKLIGEDAAKKVRRHEPRDIQKYESRERVRRLIGMLKQVDDALQANQERREASALDAVDFAKIDFSPFTGGAESEPTTPPPEEKKDMAEAKDAATSGDGSGAELEKLQRKLKDFEITWDDFVSPIEEFKEKKGFTRENVRDVLKTLGERVPKKELEEKQQRISDLEEELKKARREPAAASSTAPPAATEGSQAAPAAPAPNAGVSKWGAWHTVTLVVAVLVAAVAITVVAVGANQGWFSSSEDDGESVEQLLAPWKGPNSNQQPAEESK